MTLLIKDFVKKYLVLVFLFSKKCYVHNIFTILWNDITQIYSILLIYLLAPCPHTQPNPFPFAIFFFFFLSHKSQPFTFCLLSFSHFSAFLHTFSHTTHTHAPLHLDLLYSFLLSKTLPNSKGFFEIRYVKHK